MRTPEWFHARDVAAVANDTLTFEVFPPEIENLWLPVHALHLVELVEGPRQQQDVPADATAFADPARVIYAPAIPNLRAPR